MTKTLQCFQCKNEIADTEEIHFCPICLAQLKCRSCSTLLIKNAAGCTYCGKPVKSSVAEVSFNEFEFEQKGDSKKIKAKFTNEVSAHLASWGIFGQNAPSVAFRATSSKPTSFAPQINFNSPTSIEQAALVADLSGESAMQLLQQIFKVEGEVLLLINPRVKHSGKLDQAIRISILLLFAYDSVGKPNLERRLLNDVLSHAKLLDGNFKTWIAGCDEITVRSDGKLELSLPGKTAAQSILLEFSDPSIEKGKISFTRKKNGSKKKKKESDVLETKQQVSQSSGLVTILKELISEGFFSNKKKIGEIVEHCKVSKGKTFRSNDISSKLIRFIREKKLNRERNKENQYEYFTN